LPKPKPARQALQAGAGFQAAAMRAAKLPSPAAGKYPPAPTHRCGGHQSQAGQAGHRIKVFAQTLKARSSRNAAAMARNGARIAPDKARKPARPISAPELSPPASGAKACIT